MNGRRRRAGGWVVLALLLVIGLSSCRAEPQDPEIRAPQTSSVERGPINLSVIAGPTAVEVGDRVQLRIEATAPSGVVIQMPEVGDTIGSFTVLERTTPRDIPEGDVRRWRHEYVLDCYSPGEHEIPALELRFVDGRSDAAGDDGDPIEGQLRSEPIAMTVASVLDADETDEPRDIRSAVAVPRDGLAWWQWTLLGLAVVASLCLRMLYRRWLRNRGRAASPQLEPIVPADVWARQALAALREADLVDRGAFDEFYTRLSGIVREYIERRFGLMAPERTTEEFLREAGRSSELGPGHQALLETLLRSADLVKFARHVPEASDAHDAMDAASAFVEETAPRVAGVPVGADAA